MDAAPNPGRLPVLTMARGLCARKRSRSGSGWANAGSRVANGAEWCRMVWDAIREIVASKQDALGLDLH